MCVVEERGEQLLIKNLAVVKECFMFNQQQKYCVLRNLYFFPLKDFFKWGRKKLESQLLNHQMLPFQSSSSSSFLLNFTSPSKHSEALISDIQSDNKSVNENLCESFQGLLKKQEPQESTRSSFWSQSQKQIASAHIVRKNDQNQIKQKVKHYTTIWNFQDQASQNPEITKIQLENVDSFKKRFIENRSKIKKYRDQLLPYPCYTKLPIEILRMIHISEKIDHHLFEKKSVQYMDNVNNIFKAIFSEQQMSSIWSIVKKLLFISEDHYKIQVDPLKNLCITFGNKKNIKLQQRKHKLRCLLGQYYFTHKKEFHQEGIPEAYVQPLKTSRFYPQNLNMSSMIDEKKLKTKFVKDITASVKRKQIKLQEKYSSLESADPQSQYIKTQAIICPEEMLQFCDTISRIYLQKNVFHMYKATLIQNLRNKSTFSLQKIFFFIKWIIEEGLFLEVIVKSGCSIFRIVEKQKLSLIEILKVKKESNSL